MDYTAVVDIFDGLEDGADECGSVAVDKGKYQ
jgi:hypothetical protein